MVVMPSSSSYQLPCPAAEVERYVELEILPALSKLGYEPIVRAERETALVGMRRPRWTVVLAVFLFPVGLPLLLIKRTRELRLIWTRADPCTLQLSGDDPAPKRLLARRIPGGPSEPSAHDTIAIPSTVGAVLVLAIWLASVQLVHEGLVFVLAIFLAVVVSCGVGALIGYSRASRSDLARDPIIWGALPALAGALLAVALMSALVGLLVQFGASG